MSAPSATKSPIHVTLALVVLSALAFLLAGAPSASAAADTTTPVSTVLEGQPFEVAGAAPVVNLSTQQPIASVSGEPVVLGEGILDSFFNGAKVAIDNPGLVFGYAKDLLKAPTHAAGTCIDVFQWVDHGGDTCLEAVKEAIAEPFMAAASASLRAVWITMNTAIRGTVLWLTNWTFDILLGTSNKDSAAVNDFQHGVAAPVLTQSWFQQQFDVSKQIALYLVAPLFMLTIIQSIIKGSLFFLIRSAVIMVPAAVLGSVAVVEMTRRLLWISDNMSTAITDSMMTDGHRDWFTNALNVYRADTYGLFETLWFVVCIIAIFVIYCELLLRQLGIYMAAFFMPLAFAALVWPSTAKFARRLVEVLIGLIFSKVFIVAALSLGFAALGKPDMAGSTANASATPAAVTAPSGDGTPTVLGAVSPNDAFVTNAEPDDPEKAAALAIISSGVAIFFMAAFTGYKVIDLAPGASMAVQGRIGNGPGALMSKGFILSTGLGALTGKLQNKSKNVTPKADAPRNTKGAAPLPVAPAAPSPEPAPSSGANGGGQKAASTGGAGSGAYDPKAGSKGQSNQHPGGDAGSQAQTKPKPETQHRSMHPGGAGASPAAAAKRKQSSGGATSSMHPGGGGARKPPPTPS